MGRRDEDSPEGGAVRNPSEMPCLGIQPVAVREGGDSIFRVFVKVEVMNIVIMMLGG